MGDNFPKIFGIGLAALVVVVAFAFFANRGNHLAPKGSVLKTRTLELNETTSLLALDIRLVNDSDVTMVPSAIAITVDLANGASLDGAVLSKADLKSTFHYYPLLGEQFNETLAPGDEIPARSKADRMIAASFAAPLAGLDARKKMTVKITDATGAVAEFSHK